MPKALAVLLNTAIYQMFMALLLDANFFKSSKKWFENCTERTTTLTLSNVENPQILWICGFFVFIHNYCKEHQ
ncbi:hypothetical protein QW060_08850 [Myroides ceti]|uniref:Secreted protein n=1 Tax=Paenimyroides ceti TaxID=395087 RepID=A0ABT8CVN5_9FLAO|nr:hypothetical protein [Paenimyroides ceti]MDN3707242.1 hypothetical protein [Paenimyroides ceti]